MTNRQLESTYAQLARVISEIQDSMRTELIPVGEGDFLANAFAASEDEMSLEFHLQNQAAFNEAHPIIAARNRKKVGASSKSSKLAKEATINSLLTDKDLSPEDTKKLIRRAFANRDSVQVQWRTVSTSYHEEPNLFRIVMDLSCSHVISAVTDVTAIPHIARL